MRGAGGFPRYLLALVVLGTACGNPVEDRVHTRAISSDTAKALVADANWSRRSFFGDRLGLRLPQGLVAIPPPDLPFPPGGEQVWLGTEDRAFAVLIRRDQHLRGADVSGVCNHISAIDIASKGGRILSREMVQGARRPTCSLEVRVQDTLAREHVLSLEERQVTVAVYFAERSGGAARQAAERILASVEHLPVAADSACDANAAALCVDDRHLGSCRAGHWVIMDCDEACKQHGYVVPGEGCIRLPAKDEVICVCEPL